MYYHSINKHVVKVAGNTFIRRIWHNAVRCARIYFNFNVGVEQDLCRADPRNMFALGSACAVIPALAVWGASSFIIVVARLYTRASFWQSTKVAKPPAARECASVRATQCQGSTERDCLQEERWNCPAVPYSRAASLIIYSMPVNNTVSR